MGSNLCHKRKLNLISTKLECPVCYEQYDNDQHQPMIICENYHDICKYCLVQHDVCRKCPICKSNLDGLIQNFCSDQNQNFWWKSEDYKNKIRVYHKSNFTILCQFYKEKYLLTALILLNIFSLLGNFSNQNVNAKTLCLNALFQDSTLIFRRWLLEMSIFQIIIFFMLQLLPIATCLVGYFKSNDLLVASKIYSGSQIMKCWIMSPTLWTMYEQLEPKKCEKSFRHYIYFLIVYSVVVILVTTFDFIGNISTAFYQKRLKYIRKNYLSSENSWITALVIFFQITLLEADIYFSNVKVMANKLNSGPGMEFIPAFFQISIYSSAILLMYLFVNISQHKRWQPPARDEKHMKQSQIMYLLGLSIKLFAQFLMQWSISNDENHTINWNQHFTQYFSITIKARAIGCFVIAALFSFRLSNLSKSLHFKKIK